MTTIKTPDGTIIEVEGESKFFRHPEVTDADRLKSLIENRKKLIEEDPSWETKWKIK